MKSIDKLKERCVFHMSDQCLFSLHLLYILFIFFKNKLMSTCYIQDQGNFSQKNIIIVKVWRLALGEVTFIPF